VSVSIYWLAGLNPFAGINIVMACAEGEVVADPGVQKAALLLLCHLLGGPIIRPGCSRHNADRWVAPLPFPVIATVITYLYIRISFHNLSFECAGSGS